MKESSLVKLTINNAQFYSYHGVKQEEQKLGGKYQIDADLFYNSTKAVVNDDVNSALNYEMVLFEIKEILDNENYNLVETIASELLNMLMEKFDLLEKATLRVRKINVPVSYIVDNIQVEQSITRKV